MLRELRKKRRLWKKVSNGKSKEEYEQAAKKVICKERYGEEVGE